MSARFSSLLMTVILAGCATQPPYSDSTVLLERKAYAACAITRAFLSSETDASTQTLARNAILQCQRERQMVYAKLLAENTGKPAAAAFADGYMDELDAIMLKHLAMRLAEARQRRSGDNET
jgi:hypothetical protein